jgi:ribose/xylose/arabinose/galactoside ABC-type transport system permease subunit
MEKSDTSPSQSVSDTHWSSRTVLFQSIAKKLLSSNELGILLVLILMVAFIGANRPNFISVNSFSNVGQRASWYGIMALGTVFLLSMGEIDLSIGANYAVCINAAAILMAEHGQRRRRWQVC